MLADAVFIASKDLRINWRRRFLFTQQLPFVFISLLLFGIAFDADRPLLKQVAPGLVWVVMLFAGMLASSRIFSSEDVDGARERLRTTKVDFAGVFIGKSIALLLELAVILFATLLGVVILFGAHVTSLGALIVVSALAIAGMAPAITMYSSLTAGVSGADSLLPVLILPVLAPVLLSAARSWEDALGVTAGSPWGAAGFLLAFAVVFWSVGILLVGWMESE